MSAIISKIVTEGLKVVIALLILLVAFKVISVFSKKLAVKLEKDEKVDKTLSRALINAGSIALKILVVIALIGYLGIETSGISAVIASLGVCVGLAVNGTVSNLAGGVMLLITRPFKVGDYISAQGTDGVVENVGICYTKLLSLDNKSIYLPNSGLSTGSVVNYSEMPTRRVDLDFSIGGNEPAKVRKLLLEICEKDERIFSDPAPFVRMTDFGAGNGVKMTLRVWVKGADYWDVYMDILDAAEKSFSENGVVIPFNQLDVHIKNS
ncbi:MAG: mechanosensitive ion channel [Clostridia bacterium]|nr:mechanosensitive ion channel [Clostridia bacterium]